MQSLTGDLMQCFLGTPVNNVTGNTNLNGGFVVTPGLDVGILNQVTGTPSTNFGPGTFAFINPETNLTVGSTPPSNCCPLILAGASLYSKDMLNKFEGGYLRPIFSKKINPRNIKAIYRIDPCPPQPGVYHIGTTPLTQSTTVPAITDVEVTNITCTGTGVTWVGGGNTSTSVSVVSSANGITLGGSVTVIASPLTNPTSFTVNLSALTITGTPAVGDIFTATFGSGANTCTLTFQVTNVDIEAGNQCCYDFVCDTAYHFKFDLHGTPAYQAFNGWITREFAITTPCCDPSSPADIHVDGGWVYWQLALQVLSDPQLSNYILPILWYGGNYYYPDNTVAPGYTLPSGVTRTYNKNGLYNGSTLVPFVPLGTTVCPVDSGMVIQTAYVETRFKDCTFQPQDGFTYDVVRLEFSLVNWSSTHCKSDICFYKECTGHTGEGSGESVVRDFIHSEYHRSFFGPGVCDLRMREVLQGDQLYSAISRTTRYTRYKIIYWEETTGNWNAKTPNTQWEINIYTIGPNTALETFLTNWTSGCGCNPLQVLRCNQCDLSNLDPLTITPATNV
jgi:hypothetical protein